MTILTKRGRKRNFWIKYGRPFAPNIKKIGDLGNITWAKKPKHLPVFFTRDEVKAILSHLSGVNALMAQLLYGAGLRLSECLRLRVKDIDFGSNQIIVRDGKGEKDRVTMLPQNIKKSLQTHLEKVKRLHAMDLQNGLGTVTLPYALARKYPQINREFAWLRPASYRRVRNRSGAFICHAHLGSGL